MTNFFNRPSFGGLVGSGYPISGLGKSSAFCSNPLGFEYFFNSLFFG
jgi:hypothetical protein